jgi:hypothetical protein
MHQITHLLRVLRSYASYYYRASRTHRALDRDSPDGRAVEPPTRGAALRWALRYLQVPRQPLTTPTGFPRREGAAP